MSTRTARLDARALSLLESLPRPLRLIVLRREFPHVVNRLAAAWVEPRVFEHVMRTMLVHDRPGRQGFPKAALAELQELHRYYVRDVHPELARDPHRVRGR